MSLRLVSILLQVTMMIAPAAVWADRSPADSTSTQPKNPPMFQNENDRAAQQMVRTLCGSESGYYGSVDAPIYVARKPMANCVLKLPSGVTR